MIYSKNPLNENDYIQVAPNYYMLKQDASDLKYEEGHIELCTCVAKRRNPLVFTGQSACAFMGIGRIDDYEMRPHAIATCHKSSDIIRWHFGQRENKVRTIRDMSIASPIRAICDLAGYETADSILAAINSCLYQRLFTLYEFMKFIQRHPGRKWSNYLTRIASFATDKSESPLETLGWITIYKEKFIMPKQQINIIDGPSFKSRVDMLWEFSGRKIILELDGNTKYKDNPRPSKNLPYYQEEYNQVAVNEKWREDKLRSMDYEFIRSSWTKIKTGNLTQVLTEAGIPRRRSFGKRFPGFKK
jgi:hypothetical protein